MYGSDNVKTAESYIYEQKRQTEIFNEEIPDVDISKLVGNQRRIFLKILSHYQQLLRGTNPPPLTINIDGTAGTGKSFLIWAITKAITNLAHERGHMSPIIRIASDDEAEGLAEKLLLMEGAKVMLTRNIWTTQGLTNGSIGTIGTIFPEIL